MTNTFLKWERGTNIFLKWMEKKKQWDKNMWEKGLDVDHDTQLWNSGTNVNGN